MVLEGKDCDENAHEGGHGRYRQNGIVGFWVVRWHNLAQSATKCTYLQFMVLEGKDCDKNLHEGEHGCCRRNEIIYNKMILTL